MTEDDTSSCLKKLSHERHGIFKKQEQINSRIEFLQTEIEKQTRYIGAANHRIVELLERELQQLIDDGYGLEVQLTQIMGHLKVIRLNESELIA